MLKKLHVFVHLVLFHKVIIVCQLSDVNLMKILLMDNVNVNMDGLELDLLVFRLVELINIMMVKIVSVKKDMLNLIQFVNNVEVVVYLMFQKLHVFVMTHYNFMISKKDNVWTVQQIQLLTLMTLIAFVNQVIKNKMDNVIPSAQLNLVQILMVNVSVQVVNSWVVINVLHHHHAQIVLHLMLLQKLVFVILEVKILSMEYVNRVMKIVHGLKTNVYVTLVSLESVVFVVYVMLEQNMMAKIVYVIGVISVIVIYVLHAILAVANVLVHRQINVNLVQMYH